MSTDLLLGRYRSGNTYTCIHFACDVIDHLYGARRSEHIRAFIDGAHVSNAKKITLLAYPKSPCVVLLQRKGSAHIGVYLDGRVLHLPERGGSRYESIESVSVGFLKVRYIDV